MGTSLLLQPNDSSSIVTHPNSNQSTRRNRLPTTVNPSSQDGNRTHSGGDRNCTVKHPGLNLVMGQVKILKRGEKLSPGNVIKSEGEACYDSMLGSTDRFGPDPQTMKKEVRVHDLMEGLYAGLTVSSPPPSSVPVPGFLGMQRGADDFVVSLFK
ncbi:uncharacterized protein LOC131597189 [Vicia villosa]|uniref:uncharacterized protein LOC131597189 n=1 Tax=Vicia villosa TaxID=3911 RepID=UPI00273BABF8|nr:uncharacterized protein LOC131597189 [Vicia villosa]